MDSSMGSDWTPAGDPVTVTEGDRLVPIDPITVAVETSPGVEVDVTGLSAFAQVRRTRSRTSELILELPLTVTGNVISFDEVTIPPNVGRFHWDVQVSWTDGPSRLTLVSDVFRVLSQVTVETS